MFALVDCNNFYASCERVFRPDLNGKPVVVLSNNDGCVIARSNEAKKIGIPMGAPAFQFKNIFEQNKVHVFSANFALYGDMSKRVMTILSQFSPDIEIYSIDEAFIDLSGFKYVKYEEYALQIKKTIFKSTGIPVSVGVAPTKTLAKVATEIAKKFPQRTNGVYVIDTEEKRIKALKWLPIEDVWGIGRQHSKRLKKMRITKAYDFVQLSDYWIKKHMTVQGLRLKKELLGTPVIEMEIHQTKKSIATTRTFEKMYTEFDDLRERIVTFAVTSSEKLRRQNNYCNALMVFIKTNKHRKDQPQYYNNIVLELPYPSNSAIELAKCAVDGLKKIYRKGYHYKKAGVILLDFSPIKEYQLSIFGNSNPKHQKLMSIVDKLNTEYGKRTIKLASQDLKRTWKMNQNLLSPRYTTRIEDVIKINV